MARLGRYFLPDQPLHVIQRGNNRQAIFFDEVDYAWFRTFLAEAADACGCAIHAYVFMTNHIHLLVTPNRETSLPRMMQSLGRRYVRQVNDVYRRTGTLWEGRYRAAPIDSEPYFLTCCRYIELNPVRARMSATLRDYPWSSYQANAHGVPDPLIRKHDLYQRLGRLPPPHDHSHHRPRRPRRGLAVVGSRSYNWKALFVIVNLFPTPSPGADAPESDVANVARPLDMGSCARVVSPPVLSGDSPVGTP